MSREAVLWAAIGVSRVIATLMGEVRENGLNKGPVSHADCPYSTVMSRDKNSTRAASRWTR